MGSFRVGYRSTNFCQIQFDHHHLDELSDCDITFRFGHQPHSLLDCQRQLFDQFKVGELLDFLAPSALMVSDISD